MPRPTTVAIGGFTSEVGKTTVMCNLLAAFPGWEAIKTTRGHYRSCGKDPHACCVSHLLSDQPVIHSGYTDTYSKGKDTGRYWDAGAANVHWLIVTEAQIEKGIQHALSRVAGPGVFVEGNSFAEFVPVDFMLIVARAEGQKIKATARRALRRAAGLYLSEADEALRGLAGGSGARSAEAPSQKGSSSAPRQRFAAWRERTRLDELRSNLPIYTSQDLPQLVSELQRIHVKQVSDIR